MATEWFYKTTGDERGPVQFRELVALARSGAVTRADFVRSTWHKEWQPAETILRDYLAVSTVQPETAWAETVKAAMLA